MVRELPQGILEIPLQCSDDMFRVFFFHESWVMTTLADPATQHPAFLDDLCATHGNNGHPFSIFPGLFTSAFAERLREADAKRPKRRFWTPEPSKFARRCLELLGWSWKSSLWTWKIWRNLKIWIKWIESGFWLWIIWSAWKLFWENQGLTPETRAVSGQVTWQSRHKFVSISAGWNFRFR